MLPWDLEDWLTEEGDRIVRMEADGRPLSEIDRLIHEIWLLDTETRNGGLSQYFANWGVEQWQVCVLAASKGLTPSFPPFAAEVDAMIGDSLDPCESISSLGSPADAIWDKYKVAVVTVVSNLTTASSARVNDRAPSSGMGAALMRSVSPLQWIAN